MQRRELRRTSHTSDPYRGLIVIFGLLLAMAVPAVGTRAQPPSAAQPPAGLPPVTKRVTNLQADEASSRRDRSPERSGRRLMTGGTQTSVNRGLAYLANRQHDDGSFWSGAPYRHEVAVTALTGMAFLSAGHLPNRGEYGGQVQRAVEFLLTCRQPNGQILNRDSQSHGPMYGHGFATLFLAEAYGTSPDPRIRNALAAAVKLIVASQSEEGGWRYNPDSSDADLSVTVCQVMALRAARNAGLAVPKETIDRSIDYVKKCQNTDGGFMYQLTRRGTSDFPRSAAGIVALYSAGVYTGTEIEKGLAYLMRSLPRPGVFRTPHYYFYGHYYAVQAMWQTGGGDWERWYSAIRDELLAQQKPDGHWSDPSVCDEYGTAMALLILQIPNDYVPIFQR